MEQGSHNVHITSEGSDSDSNNNVPASNVDPLSHSSNEVDQQDGSEWETDEGEGQDGQDAEMSSPAPPFIEGLGSIPYFGSIDLGHFEVDDDDIDDEDIDDEEDFDSESEMWDEDLDMESDFYDDESGLEDDAFIENITPSCRAVYRGDEEDIMSEFSGDEKYEPREVLTGNDGEGEEDMYDYSETHDHDFRNDGARLTMKMRQLFIKLDKGRREWERLHGIQTTPSEQAGHTTSTQPEIQNRQFSLHRLIVRGPDQPQELSYSPSTIHHPQCGNSLVVAPSNLGLRDDIYTTYEDGIIRCGILKAMTHELYEERRRNYWHSDDDRPLPELVNPSTVPLKMRKATKFLDRSLYDYRRLPVNERLIFTDRESVICMAVRYGFLVLGTQSGTIITYCIQDNAPPSLVYEGPIGPGDDPEDDPTMINSVDIARWPRYHNPTATLPDQDMEVHGSDEVTDPEDENEHADPTARLTEKGVHDHYLVMTGNDRGLFIVSMPDHVVPDTQPSMMSLEDECHPFKFKRDHTWIRKGFDGEWLNDARVSPDGKWIAVVGDAQKVWVIKVEHVPETEEQRLQRQKEERQQMLEELETDESEYESDKDDRVRRRHKTEVVEILDDDLEDSNQGTHKAQDSSEPKKTRLLHLFGRPETLVIPDHVIREPRVRRRGNHTSASLFTDDPNTTYTSQYIAWNASSTKFAHTSDSHSRILVWAMPSKQLVCCVDAGGLSFAISFHPKLDNVFAFTNRYGFVHVVDVTDCCVGDQNFVLSKEKHRFNKASTKGTAVSTLPASSSNAIEQAEGSMEAEKTVEECGPPHYQEKHDVLMISFRGQQDRRLRILEGLNGLSWGTDGRHLYVATNRRVLRYMIADPNVRIPSLFDICANRAKEWLEHRMLTRHNKQKGPRLQEYVDILHQPLPKEWGFVPSWIKQRIFGDHVQLRYHDG
ncbi:hypothetical protein BGW42_003264 [Actinomortierella wolfii]|nr:hypothetical protein BGW42_003264 [Actinomortierella wolfii]